MADSPGAPSSVPELGKTEPAVSEENLSEPAAIAGNGAPGAAGPSGAAGAQGFPGVGGAESEGPVGPQGSPAIGAIEEHATVATEPREGSVGDSQSPQPSPGNGDAAIPGFSIRYEVLFAMAATAAALILLLALFGLYRFWLGRHAVGKPGTNGAADPSLLVNRPKLGNGGG